MAFPFEFPTNQLVDKTKTSYWTTLYTYFVESSLKELFDFSELSLEDGKVGFSFTYKPGIPLSIEYEDFDMFYIQEDTSTPGKIKYLQKYVFSGYPQCIKTYDTENYTNNIPIRIYKTENTICLTGFSTFNVDTLNDMPIVTCFTDGGNGMVGYNPTYGTFMGYGVGAAGLISNGNIGVYSSTQNGKTNKFFLRPLQIGDAVFYGVYGIDGGVTLDANKIFGEFLFDDEKFNGFNVPQGQPTNLVLKQ